ncbi:DNA repair protein REV1 [Apiospora saccharicola]|uniref:DNA repair protein REV1 n=1 Tax=Apiospora saccharicola TaxID=335842 RepID=A0ABR1WFR5_9PEZI
MGSRLEKNSNAVRKRIEGHTFSDEGGEEYEASAFGGFNDYFRRKKIKLQNLDSELRASTNDSPQIFKGVVAHVTGYTQPPLHILHRELVQHGAGFLQYLDSKTMATHIIASHLPPKKMVEFNKYRIVKPAWVVDSIQAGKLLLWSDYRVIEETPRQKTLKFDGMNLASQANTQTSPLAGYREQSNNSYYTSQLKGFAETIDGANTHNSSPAQSHMHTPSKYQAVSANNPPSAPAKSEAKKDESGMPQSTDISAEGDEIILVQHPDAQEDVTTLNEDAPTTEEVESAHTEISKEMTSEEHNATLLLDPRMRKSSTANPDFIKQYYAESRLHHLSTWKAELKSRMQKLASEKGPQAKPRKRTPGARRYIMHVDFDSFFCAVSLKNAPHFADKPTVVAHGAGNGSEIASCNYRARKFGVKNGMWMKKARELCPELNVLPYDFPAYEEASRLFYASILEVGGVVQSVSIDEALIDVTSVILKAAGSSGGGVDEGSIWREQEKADQIALDLRGLVKERTGCAVSVGIGGNILLAKVALRKAKPAGQFQINPEDVLTILGELKVDDLPGVAYSITGKLEEIGVKLVSDIRQISKERLTGTLGPKTGEKLWEYARGIDRAEVGDQPIRKSVSAEVNWGIRFINQEEAEEFVFNLCKELERRLLNEQVKGKQLTMKIMRRSADAPLDPPKNLGHGKCDTFNKSTLFGVATHDAQVLGKEAVVMLRSFKFNAGDLRGLGVQLTKLEPLKTSATAPDGSQKQLDFRNFRASTMKTKTTLDSIQDAGSPEKSKAAPGRSGSNDPIIDGPLTPRKPKGNAVHPAFNLAKVSEKDDKARTPLNIGGTQFVIPSNPDPAVLAELPNDIRARLLAQASRSSESRESSPAPGRSRTQSPALSLDETPPGFDPEVFGALPDDVKMEILAPYKPTRAAGPSSQTRLPQSPRKDRLIQPTKKTTPTKRRGRPAGMPSLRARERQADANAKIVQTNFRSLRTNSSNNNNQNDQAGDGDEGDGATAIEGADMIDDAAWEELNPEFLAELPEDVRREVVAEHRLMKAQHFGLDLRAVENNRKRLLQEIDDDEEDLVLPGGQTTLHFGPKPTKVAFTSAGLSTVAEITEMMNVWYRSTTAEGPHRSDAEMLEKYLVRVVLEERALTKVVKIVKWLAYLNEADVSNSPGKTCWKAVLQDLKDAIQKAMHSVGRGSLII